ncbi:plasmid transfer protein TraA [Streptomyces sp. NPDC052042]|uniref:plasmid transfer protein TraA n=1 Tax=Streptomyces sp. NPDC052042 TaxID=3365683 RepID=UPI0037D8F1B1
MATTHTNVPPQSGANGSQTKSDKAYNKNFGATFSPGLTVTVNAGNKTNSAPAQGFNGGGSGGGRGSHTLPEPFFTSPADIREYCNHLRAVGISLSFEVAMGAEILQATLATVPDPEGKAFGSKLRARKVARKLKKSAEALKDAATNAAATYAAFQQEYEEEINRVRHRARRPQARRMDWANQ